MTPEQILGAVLSVAVVVLAFLWWRALGRVGRANRRRQAIASQGEADAERVLAAAGYAVVARQVTGTFVMEVDGERVEVRCRADLVVEGRGRFVAEVKTGDRAADPTHPATRRQLLEYALAFDVDGVLLVDMVERSVHAVSFPGAGDRRRAGLR